MPTTPMSARCCIPASRSGRRRLRPPSTSARRGREVLAAVVAGYETTIRIGLAVQPGAFPARLPEHRHLRRLRHRGGRRPAPVRGRTPSGEFVEAHRACRQLPERRRAVLLFRLVRQAHPGRACGAERGRGGAADAAGLQRARRHHRRQRRLCARLCRRLGSGDDRGRARRALSSDGRAGEIPCRGGARRGRHRRACWRCGSSTASPATTSRACSSAFPRIIQGRLTNPHPVDLQAAQMCLPFSVALASKVAARGRAAPDADGRRTTRPGLRDRRLYELEDRTTIELDDEVEAASNALSTAARVSVRLRDGRELSLLVPAPQGQPPRPFTGAGARGALRAGAVEPRARQDLRRDRRDVAGSRPARSALAWRGGSGRR